MADSTYNDDEDDKIARLMSMGFDIASSQMALVKNNGDVSRAIDSLLLLQYDDDGDYGENIRGDGGDFRDGGNGVDSNLVGSPDRPARTKVVAKASPTCVSRGAGGLEVVSGDEAPVPAEYTASFPKINDEKLYRSKMMKKTAAKSANSSGGQTESQNRRAMDPPADLEFFPGQNSPTPSKIDERKQALLEKLRLAGIALPSGSSNTAAATSIVQARSEPAALASGVGAESNESAPEFSSSEEDISSSGEQQVTNSNLQELDTEEANAEEEEESPTSSPSTFSAIRRLFMPPQFIGLDTTSVSYRNTADTNADANTAPVYDAFCVPVGENIPINARTSNSIHASIQDPSDSNENENSSTGSVFNHMAHSDSMQEQARINVSRQPQQQTSDSSSSDVDNLQWWKRHKIMALVIVVIIPVGTVTVASATAMARQKNKNDPIPKGAELSVIDSDASETSVGDGKGGDSLDRPSWQPSFAPDYDEHVGIIVDDNNAPMPTTPSKEDKESKPTDDIVTVPTKSPRPTVGVITGGGDTPLFPSSSLTPLTENPTQSPAAEPTNEPSMHRTTREPTNDPTKSPTEPPTADPTESPTKYPTESPSVSPTRSPTQSPTEPPTNPPTEPPTEAPTKPPTHPPTEPPTKSPTFLPTEPPTRCNPCHWGDVWSKWSECSSVCDGIATRKKTDCVCGPNACLGGCPANEVQESPCNESYGRIRFKSERVCDDYGGCWLHVTSSGRMEANDAYYTYFEQCGDGFLVIEGTNQCLESSGASTCNQGWCQQWEVKSIGGSYQIRNICNSCCLTVIDLSARRELVEFSERFGVSCFSRCDSSDAQQWVTWDKPAFCESGSCANEPVPPTSKIPTSPKPTKAPHVHTPKPTMIKPTKAPHVHTPKPVIQHLHTPKPLMPTPDIKPPTPDIKPPAIKPPGVKPRI